MRIVAAASPSIATASPRAAARTRTRVRVEWLGLAATTIALVVGLALTVSRQSAGIGLETVVNLNTASPETIAAALHALPDTAARDAAARAIAERLATSGPLTHVGALASLRDAEGNRLFSVSQIAAIKPGVAVRTADEYSRMAFRGLAIFFAVFWLVHIVRRAGGRIGDPLLLPAVHVLTGVGLMALIALRDPIRDTDAATGFVYGVALGALIYAVLSYVDLENPRLRHATLLPLGGAVALAIALVLFGSGPGESGAKVNLLGVQPIEAIRLLAIFALASYFSRRWELLREISQPVGPPALRRHVRLPRSRDVKPLALIVGTLLVFFVLQRDLGPALVLGCIALGMYGVARARVSLVTLGFAGLAAGVAAGYWLGIPGTLARRVAIWLDPWNNTRAGGDQVVHAFWALASGGPLGAGAAHGEPHLVPAGQTDLILSVIGEELGFVGLLAIAGVYALLAWRALRVSARAPGDFTAFLALGSALALTVPVIVIAAGQFGLLPLSGVATPFLSFGKSSTIASFAALGILSTVAARAGAPRPAFVRPLRVAGGVLAAAMIAIVGRAAWLQVYAADEVALRPALVREADGDVRYRYNPRLLMAARLLPRGAVLDRNGYALATNDKAAADRFAERLQSVRAGVRASCDSDSPGSTRCYPLGGLAYHVIGDATRQTNWAARNTSFIEREWNPILQGFDDRARPVDVQGPDGRIHTVIERDYSDLLPLVRGGPQPRSAAARRVLERPRDVQTTIDGAFQALVARALEARARDSKSERGAVVVLDPRTGEILALASYPWPALGAGAREAIDPAQLLDRARYGLYPPGSAFKLVTAAAALGSSAGGPLPSFVCQRLPDGRVGAKLRGHSRPVRDDERDTIPHGRVDLRRAITVSCNAYFAQLAEHLGATALGAAADATGIRLAASTERLNATLPHAGYGQGDVLASPMRMARLVGAIATDGVIRDASLADTGENGGHEGVRWIRAADAAFLRQTMREVVTSGSGRSLANHPVPIAGKTGTAEVSGRASHSWFVGFAPYESPRIAFAVIVENAGYGGRVAAPLAGDVVSAAAAVGLLK